MKTLLIAFLLSLFSTGATDVDSTLDRLRLLYMQASENEEVATTLYELLKDKNGEALPIIQGYAGASETVQASFQRGALNKFEYFVNGKRKLESAIERAPENIELRYLRLTVQYNCPSFLGYRKEIKPDKAMLVKALLNGTQKSGTLHRNIADFLLQTDLLTAEEIQKINQLK